MEGSSAASLDAADDGPESWEVAEVDASMRRLMLSSRKDSDANCSKQDEITNGSDSVFGLVSSSGTGLGMKSVSGPAVDLINTVDQFLLEAIQNPRERLSVLRMEQEVERFIRDPTREQMEFQQLPTSYLRLAAHRIAQHYSLQSMVFLDNNFPDMSGSKIIVRKTSNLQLPLVRLADIPVNLPTEESGPVKVAIKQRPQKDSAINSNSYAHSSKSNSSKSVEERKEEYNKARARIFSSNSYSGNSRGRPESNQKIQDRFHHGSLGMAKIEERFFPGGASDVTTISRSLSESATSSSRLPRSRTEKEPIGRQKTNNKVAIFRDLEVDRKDPDYNRSYERYMQRFDPGFGFAGGPYTIQPMYAPALNYNTEFPQLGSNQLPPFSSERQPRSHLQRLPGQWVSPSPPTGIGHGPPETMLPPFGSSHVNARPNSGLYMHSTHYPCQQSGLPYIHPLEPIHPPFPQPQPDASFGFARPR